MIGTRPRARSRLRWIALGGLCVVLLMSAPSASASAETASLYSQLDQRQSMVASAPSAAQINQALKQRTGYTTGQVTAEDVCPKPAQSDEARCAAQVLVTRAGHHIIHPAPGPRQRPEQTGSAHPALSPPVSNPQALPTPYTPAYLQEAYDLSWLSANRGAGDTVAVVDEGYDTTAAADLAKFRSQSGLSPVFAAGAPGSCSTAGSAPCFRQVDEYGSSAAGDLANMGPPGSDWQQETTLDIDAVSSICPNCNILLVEQGNAEFSVAQQTAANLGATQISNSWSAGGVPAGYSFTFPGVLTVASGGDTGYGAENFPADRPDVLAAGGTTLAASTGVPTGRGFGESVWNWQGIYQNPEATTSGCDTDEAKPAYQHDVGCAGRAWDDLAADADPETGLEIYENGQWELYGGTSLASPLIAAYAALVGQHTNSPAWTYDDAADMFDVTAGNDLITSPGNIACPSQISYICNAGPGYDGPTGNGTISGTVALGAPGIGGPPFGGISYVAAAAGSSMSLLAGVFPNGLATSYSWQYYTYPATSYAQAQQTTAVNIGSGPGVVETSNTLTGLIVGDAYHLRLVATNADGTVYGYDQVQRANNFQQTIPVNSLVPNIAGAAVIGQTLSADQGSWNSAVGSYTYQWQRSADGSSWTNLSGQTGPAYQLTAAASGCPAAPVGGVCLGDYVRVQVTATNSAGSTTASSAQTAHVTTLTPTSTAAPQITGTPAPGQTLTATTGQWSPTPNEGYAYQWEDCDGAGESCSPIPGQTASTYALTGSDVAHTVVVQVTAFDNNGAGLPASSPATVTVTSAPVNTTPPAISGALKRLDTLTASTGGWSDTPASYAYRWQRSADGSTWSNIPNANGQTYTLAFGDEGDQIRVQVTATNPADSTTATSATTGPALANQPYMPTVPTLNGSGALNVALTVTNAAFAPSDVGPVSYQWQRSADGSTWTPIGGQTTSSYTPTSGDLGDELRVALTATNVDGTTVVDTGAVTAPPGDTSPPTVTGTAKRLDTLTAHAGPWTGGQISYGYQWQRFVDSAWSNITDAAAQTYTPLLGDEGDQIRVQVTATNATGQTVADSAPVGPVSPNAPYTTTPPTLTGAAAVSQTLAVTNTFAPSDVTVSYQWQRSSDNGTTWAVITGQTAAQYTPTGDDISDQIRAVLSATNADDGNVAVVADSAAVTVPALPVNTSLPTVPDSPQSGVALSAGPGGWAGATSVTVTWYRCPPVNTFRDGGCTNLGAGVTYTPTATDIGTKLLVVETATNSSGQSSVDSAPSTPVRAPAPSTPPPAYTTPAATPQPPLATEDPTVTAPTSTPPRATPNAPATATITKTGSKPIETTAGKKYANAKLTAVKHTKKRKLVITRSTGITGAVTSWACQTTGTKKCLAKRTSATSTSWTTTLTGALKITATLN